MPKDINGERVLRTTPGILANVFIVLPTSIAAGIVTARLIENARPADLGRVANATFSLGRWGISSAVTGLVAREMFGTVRDVEDVLVPEDPQNNHNTIDGEVIDVTVE